MSILHVFNMNNDQTKNDILSGKVLTFCGLNVDDLQCSDHYGVIHPGQSLVLKPTSATKYCETCWNHPGTEMRILATTEL